MKDVYNEEKKTNKSNIEIEYNIKIIDTCTVLQVRKYSKTNIVPYGTLSMLCARDHNYWYCNDDGSCSVKINTVN
jgi:hypothetical protein